ncbi:MAG TPA: class I adenylate-forming enzyme family protein, partial [Methanocorpusculum sp.]|nr:class I adenylate-forming enzyme family protein [Methanocorpusculum sp.]
MVNITTFLDENIKKSSKPIFQCPDRNKQYNRSEILGIISGIASILKKFGVSKGDRVIIYINSSPEYLFSYLAIWRIGAIAVPTNRVYTKSELEYIIRNSEPKLIITDTDGKHTLNDLDVELYVPENIDSFKNSPIIQPEPTTDTDICQIQYTSGTTGSPKGAILTHGNWISATTNESNILKLKDTDVYLGIYPMGHVGLSWGISAIKTGACYVMIDRYNKDKYIELCDKYKVTILSSMPPVI